MKDQPVSDYGEFTVPGEVRFVRRVRGPIDRVWAYLTEDKKRAAWFAGGPMELRVGGKGQLLFKHSEIAPHETPPAKMKEVHEVGIASPFTVTVCEPPQRLGFTWTGAESSKSEVLFELTPEGEDVLLVLTHRHLVSKAEIADTSSGWHMHLDVLTALLAGKPVPPFWPTVERWEKEYRQRIEAANTGR